MSYRGISLLVVGNPVYMKYAANLMISLKRHSPDIAINLITEKHLLNYLPDFCHQYDIFTEIDRSDCYDGNVKLNPGKAKVSMYPYFWKNNNWNQTVYLDVDALVIKDVDKLFEFDEETFFKCQHDTMHWAKDEVIKEHFELSADCQIHGLNSSYMFVRKCDKAELLFESAKEAMLNPLPVAKMQNNWFNNQPDELYLAIGMSKVGITSPYPDFCKYPIFFRTRQSYGAKSLNTDIIPFHFLIGCYGGERYNHKNMAILYDKLAQNNAFTLCKQHNAFKYHYLIEGKHKY